MSTPVTMAEVRRLGLDPGEVRSLDRQVAERAHRRNAATAAFTHFLDTGSAATAGPGPLEGFSAALKANIARCDTATHCGSRILAHYRSPFDATAVRRLTDAGTRWLGVTAMDEFGMGSSSEHTDLGIPRNPWNPARTAGGSSGGAAAAVAAGQVWFALGSDTGGSVRQPAHCCGIVGLKPTWGRVSRHGLVAFASSLDTIGVLARGVEDAWDVLRLMAGCDPLDATSLPVENGFACELAAGDLRGRRFGVPEDLEEIEVDPAVRTGFKETVALLQDLGAEIVPVRLGVLLEALPIYTVLSCAEAASNLLRYDGTLYGLRGAGRDHRQSLIAGRSEGFGREVKRRLLLGCHVLSEGYRGRYYLRARAGRQAVIDSFADLFQQAKILALPTAPSSAFALGSRLDDPIGMRRGDILTAPASLAQLPALTLPTGLDPAGLPLSVQLVGPRLAEESLCSAGLALEDALGFRDRREAPWR